MPPTPYTHTYTIRTQTRLRPTLSTPSPIRRSRFEPVRIGTPTYVMKESPLRHPHTFVTN